MKRALAALGFAVVPAALLLACNAILGIEEKSSRPVDPDTALPDVAIVEAGPPDAAPAKCTLDRDCVAPNPCYAAHCDTVLGACAYALCEQPTACAKATCNPNGYTCENPTSYGFETTRYAVPNVALGCKTASQCVAAAYPFLFLGTNDTAVALLVDDRLASGPRSVPLSGVAMKPAQLVTSGRRVWFLGDPQGSAPPYTLAIAWIDVPSDPTTRTLTATTVTMQAPFPSLAAFPAPNDALYVVYEDPAQGFAAAVLAPPFPDAPVLGVANPPPDAGPAADASVPMYRLPGPPAAATIAAASGARLVMYRQAAQVVNLVTDPGTPKVTNTGDLAITPPIPLLQSPRMAEGADGTLLFTAPVVPEVPTNCNCTTNARIGWLLPNGFATSLDPSVIADVEGWTNPNAPAPNITCRACPAGYFVPTIYGAWVDSKTAVIASPQSEARTLTEVRVVTRDPLTAPAKRRFTTAATDTPPGNFATDRVALVSSHGLVWLVLADSVGNNVNVTMLDPSCDAK